MKIDSMALQPFQAPGTEKSSKKETASDFEALLIGQMLKSARSDSNGWLGTGEDSSSESLVDLAEDQIAKVLAQGGGLGLGDMITKSIDQAGSSTQQISGKLR